MHICSAASVSWATALRGRGADTAVLSKTSLPVRMVPAGMTAAPTGQSPASCHFIASIPFAAGDLTTRGLATVTLGGTVFLRFLNGAVNYLTIARGKVT